MLNNILNSSICIFNIESKHSTNIYHDLMVLRIYVYKNKIYRKCDKLYKLFIFRSHLRHQRSFFIRLRQPTTLIDKSEYYIQDIEWNITTKGKKRQITSCQTFRLYFETLNTWCHFRVLVLSNIRPTLRIFLKSQIHLEHMLMLFGNNRA